MSCESRIEICYTEPRNGLFTRTVRLWKECDKVYEIALDDEEEDDDDDDNNQLRRFSTESQTQDLAQNRYPTNIY